MYPISMGKPPLLAQLQLKVAKGSWVVHVGYAKDFHPVGPGSISPLKKM